MKKFFILLCFFILTACATTRLSGIVDPNYRSNFQTQKMVVIGFGMPISEQKALENTLAKYLIKYDVHVLRGLDVFLPTRDYSDKDIYKIAKSKGADTILIVSVDSRDISETYIPPTYHFGTFTNPGYISGGYSVTEPSMNVSVHLKNTTNRETIWTAEGFSGGNSYALFSDLIISVAKTTVKELSKEGLIAQKNS